MNTHDLFFTTATVVDWKPLLLEEKHKSIITASLSFLVNNGRTDIYGFVIMPNHLHLIWKINSRYQRGQVQRDFLRFTGQQMLKEIQNDDKILYDSLITNKKDRLRQFWQRDSLNVNLFDRKILEQKLDYIHFNPVHGKWNLVNEYTDYKFSSASFYLDDDFNTHPFLKHYMEYWGH